MADSTTSVPPMVDVDNHYYEPADAFTAYIEPAFRDHAVHVRESSLGDHEIWFGDARTRHVQRPPQEILGPPGSAAGLFEQGATVADMTTGGAGAMTELADRDTRLRMMQQAGIRAAVVFPTLGLTVEHEMRVKPAACIANIAAFNRWIDEHWGFDYQDTIFSTALLTLVDVPAAVAETERCLERGARVFLVTPAAVDGVSLGNPRFDPVWARIAEAGAVVAFHVGNTGYRDALGPVMGVSSGAAIVDWTALSRFLFFRDRPISDCIAALILQNVFGRHPNLKVLSAENGAHWVPWTLGHMDRVTHAVGGIETFGAAQPYVAPSDVFREHVYVAPNPQEDIAGLVELIGDEHVVFGSDFPHPEGLAAPADAIAAMRGLDQATITKVLHDNGAALIGLVPQ